MSYNSIVFIDRSPNSLRTGPTTCQNQASSSTAARTTLTARTSFGAQPEPPLKWFVTAGMVRSRTTPTTLLIPSRLEVSKILTFKLKPSWGLSELVAWPNVKWCYARGLEKTPPRFLDFIVFYDSKQQLDAYQNDQAVKLHSIVSKTYCYTKWNNADKFNRSFKKMLFIWVLQAIMFGLIISNTYWVYFRTFFRDWSEVALNIAFFLQV